VFPCLLVHLIRHRGLPYVWVFHENEAERAGVRKTQQNTDDYQICVEDMLNKSHISFDRTLFTVSKNYEKSNGDTSSIESELRNQLERYHWEVEQAKNNFGKRKIVMTGKMGGSQDDLYVSFAMCCFWGRYIRRQTGVQKAQRIQALVADYAD
jgi:hypothetical protein